MARQIALADITAAEQILHSILIKKDEQALRHLQDHYGDILYRHIYRIVHEEIKASVVLCETFKNIWLLLGVYDPAKWGLQTWMLHIAESCAFSWEQETQRYGMSLVLAPTGS
jgi:DNA-directed RNA polymerase specialized sigma24 family protein